MARVFEEDFARYLPGVVSALTESLKQDEKVQEETVGRSLIVDLMGGC